jgi:hypothetical protein
MSDTQQIYGITYRALAQDMEVTECHGLMQDAVMLHENGRNLAKLKMIIR